MYNEVKPQSTSENVSLSKQVDRSLDKRINRVLDKQALSRLKLTSRQRIYNKRFKIPKSLQRAGKVLNGAAKVGSLGATATYGGLSVAQAVVSKDNSAGNQAIASGLSAAEASVKGIAVGSSAVKTTTKGVIVVSKAPRAIVHEVRRTVRLTKLKKYGIRLAKKKWYNVKIRGIHSAEQTFTAIGNVARAGANVAGAALTAAQKVIKSDDGTANTAINYGIQSARAIKTGADVSGRVLRKSTNVTKRTARTLSKVINPRERRMLVKSVKRQVNSIKRSVKTTVKTTQKAAKVTAKTAQTAAKAVANIAKATVQTVARLVSFIAETAPWSLLIILIVLLIILIVFLVSSVLNGVVGSVTGAGGWTISDSEPNTPEQIYENLKVFIDEASDTLGDTTQTPLKNEVDAFCNSDTTTPHKIIEYQSDKRNVLFFPANGKNAIIDGFIDDFDLEFYPDFLATLFVLMTRDKQNAEGVSDTEIYDFDFKRKDFEDFMGKVNENACQYGDTYVYKTTEEIPNCACPGQNCSTQTIPGCQCDYWDDEDGDRHYYCKGHPYCPQNHVKLQVKLYTIQEYMQQDLATIYDFSDNEKARFQATSAFIKGLMESYGGE